MRPARTSRRRLGRARAFTILEVLATLTLATIILPAAMHGILLCLATASYAKQQAQAASLAQSKLAELVATGQLQDAEMKGDFGENLPEYTWAAVVNDWEDSRLVELDVAVMWIRRGQQHFVTVSTLVYMGRSDE
jgi:type II secretory pathway pseudopilin PulG